MSAMAITGRHLFLASRSPRRRELLDQIGVRYTLIDNEVDETPGAGESAVAYVTRLAEAKATAGYIVATSTQHTVSRLSPVLGADTSVVCDHGILGKPRDRRDARSMLRQLSGRSHEVLTAIALHDGSSIKSAVSRSEVWFRELGDDDIDAYWDSGEPADKAGAYAIQGLGALFVQRIAGSYSGIVGLPVFELGELWNADNAPAGELSHMST